MSALWFNKDVEEGCVAEHSWHDTEDSLHQLRALVQGVGGSGYG